MTRRVRRPATEVFDWWQARLARHRFAAIEHGSGQGDKASWRGGRRVHPVDAARIRRVAARRSSPASAGSCPSPPTGRSCSKAAARCATSTIAYETWGDARRRRVGNAVLVCHALTGDSHAAGPLVDGHAAAGWWDGLIGPGQGRSTPTATSSCAPTCSAAARARPGPRHRIPTTAARTRPASRSCRSATGSAPRRRWPTTSASTGG